MGPDVRWVGTESGYGRETEWSVVPLETQSQDQVAANSQKQVAFAPKNMMDDDLGSRAKIRQAQNLVCTRRKSTCPSGRAGFIIRPKTRR